MKASAILAYLAVIFGGFLLFDPAAIGVAFFLVALLWLLGRAAEVVMHRHDRRP